MTAAVRVGTRGSALATAQSGTVAQDLRRLIGRPVELVVVSTRGDVDPSPLERIGGTGVFVTALREALLRGECDLAVHSLKDLPTAVADGLVVAAVPPRQDPRDALCARNGMGLADLPAGAAVGTGSPRRAAQVRSVRPDLDVVGIRGNVDTRLSRVTAGDLDAVVLARAGLARLGRLAAVTESLDPMVVMPAPGQGALAVECRADADPDLLAAVSGLDDADSRAAVVAERSLLAALEAGCTAPVGACAEVAEADHGEPEVYLRAVVVHPDGSRGIRMSITGPAAAAEGLGRRLAADLLAEGAGDLMGERAP